MLEIRHLFYQVSDESGGELGILNDVSLTIADHKFVVVTGPNGGGKTTLAKAIMGLVKPTSGSILWNGEDITGLSITDRARKGISYGFQQPPRFKGLRVRDLPEAGIDLWSFSRLTETFRQLHDEKSATLVVISHQERIIDLADEIVMVSGGVITQHGPKEEIFPQILANTVSGCSYMKEA